jgi:hypothetical protein
MDRKKIEEGKMAGKGRRGRTPRKPPALTQSQNPELTAIPSPCGRPSTPTPEGKMESKEVARTMPTPEGKGKKELKPSSDVVHLPPYDSTPEEEYYDDGWLTPEEEREKLDGWMKSELKDFIGTMPSLMGWTQSEQTDHIGTRVRAIIRRMNRGRKWDRATRAWHGGDLEEGQYMYSRHDDMDPIWKQPTPNPYWFRDAATRGPCWWMEKNYYEANKASMNFLQEPRANQANETKEAP